MTQSAKTNQKTVYYWAVQRSIVEFASTYEEATALMQKAEAAEAEEMGDDYDYFDSLCEYDYVKEVPSGGLFQDSRGYWCYGNDSLGSNVPEWVFQ